MVQILIGGRWKKGIKLERKYQKTPEGMWPQLTCFVEDIFIFHSMGSNRGGDQDVNSLFLCIKYCKTNNEKIPKKYI